MFTLFKLTIASLFVLSYGSVVYSLATIRYVVSDLKDINTELEDIPLSPLEARYRSAVLLLERNQGIMGHSLGTICFIGNCPFSFVQNFFGNPSNETVYWSLLNCVKHGIGCGKNTHWLEWGEWDNCSAVCGEGVQTRRRNCYYPGIWGSARCDGSFGDTKTCNHFEKYPCLKTSAEPDEWGKWNSWGDCEKSCGEDGRKLRTRRCEPTGLDEYCVGKRTESRRCEDIPPCSVGGSWSPWQSWSGSCQVKTCGRSYSYREKLCSNVQIGPHCTGAQTEVDYCDGKEGRRCPGSRTYVQFIEYSAVVYQPHPKTPYLSVIIRFRPIKEGLILRHTGYKSTSKFRKIKSNKVKVSYDDPNVIPDEKENFVEISIVNAKLRVSFVVEKSDKINMDVGRVKFFRWNIFRLTIVSDVVNARLNDGFNMKASLQDSPKQSKTALLSYLKSEERYWEKLWGPSRLDSPHPDAPGFSLVRSTRAIVASFKGKISLGRYKKFASFRGEISFLRVNFENYGFKTKPKSEVSTHTDPIGVNNIKYLNQSESSNHDEEHQPIFDGYHRFYVPNALIYWTRHFDPPTYRDQVDPKSLTYIDAGTLRIVFKPFAGNGVLLWNQGKYNLATQWKVLLQDGVRVKIIVDRAGGEIYTATSGDNMKFAQWNVLELVFYRRGDIQGALNGGEPFSVYPPPINRTTQPGDFIVVGGTKKFQLSGEEPTSEGEAHYSGFKGYVFSLKQNGVEFVDVGRDYRNAWGMPMTYRFQDPSFTLFWYFKPLYQDAVYNPESKHNLMERFFNFFRLFGVARKALVWDSNMTIAQIRDLGEIREIACVIPVSEDILTPPDIKWYKDEVPIKDGRSFLVRKTVSPFEVRSSVFLMPTADGSKELSGVYSCVAVQSGTSRLYVNHVVSVLNNNIADPHSYVSKVIIFVREFAGVSEMQAMLIVSGTLIGTLFLLVLICLFQKWLTRRRKKNKEDKNAKKSEKTPLISDPSPAPTDSTPDDPLLSDTAINEPEPNRKEKYVLLPDSDGEDTPLLTQDDDDETSKYDVVHELVETDVDSDLIQDDASLLSDDDVIDDVDLYDETNYSPTL